VDALNRTDITNEAGNLRDSNTTGIPAVDVDYDTLSG
jgi:hypothetical protein